MSHDGRIFPIVNLTEKEPDLKNDKNFSLYITHYDIHHNWPQCNAGILDHNGLWIKKQHIRIHTITESTCELYPPECATTGKIA